MRINELNETSSNEISLNEIKQVIHHLDSAFRLLSKDPHFSTEVRQVFDALESCEDYVWRVYKISL